MSLSSSSGSFVDLLSVYRQLFSACSSSASDIDLSSLARQVIRHPDIFVFAEFLLMPNLQRLQASENPEFRYSFELLETFSSGHWRDLSPERRAQLNDVERKKLKSLSLIAECERSSELPYSSLLQSLELSGDGELEELVRFANARGLIHSRLDQIRRVLFISRVAGRDVRDSADLNSLAAHLRAFLSHSNEMAAALKAKIADIQADTERAAEKKSRFQTELQASSLSLSLSFSDSQGNAADEEKSEGKQKTGKERRK